VTIVPGLVSLVLSSVFFTAQAFIVSQTLRVLRIFRIVRLMRIIGTTTTSSLNRQFMMLGVTVLAMVFAAAAIFQILDSTPGSFTPFLHAILYMTITIIGRPHVPTKTDAAKTLEIVVIFLASFIIPAFIAELARLYFILNNKDVKYSLVIHVYHMLLCVEKSTRHV
jgi:hypothetical protein